MSASYMHFQHISDQLEWYTFL